MVAESQQYHMPVGAASACLHNLRLLGTESHWMFLGDPANGHGTDCF